MSELPPPDATPPRRELSRRGVRLRVVAAMVAVAAGTVAVVIAVLLVRTALADGDPASDVLLGQSVFYPYAPPVSGSLQKTLNAEVAAANRAHFPIKVALIDSPIDLGAIPVLFDKPQQYANFLDQEISYQRRQALLVVMPDGYGVQGLPRAATLTAGSLPKPAGKRSDDLARAATVAVGRLAAAAGHPTNKRAATPATGSGSGSIVLTVVLLMAAAFTAAGAVGVARRRRTPGRRKVRRAPPG